MSATPASSQSATTGAGHTASARGTHAAGRKPGAHGTDHFSMLLSLLSASDATGLPALMGSGDGAGATSATDALATASTDPNATDSSHLAAVMQWMGLPQGQGARHGTAADTDADTGIAATAGRTTKGHGKGGTPSGNELDTASASGQGEALPEGMHRLDRAETPDAATLAALAQPAEGVAAETATPDQAAAAGFTSATVAPQVTAHTTSGGNRLGAHAPAGAHAQANPVVSTQSLQQQPAVSVQIERLQSRGDSTALTGTRSTVMLDERFSANAPSGDVLASAAAGSVAASAPASTGAGSSGGDLSGHNGQGSQDTSTAASSSNNDSGSNPNNSPDDSAQWAAEARAQNEERLDAFTAPTLHEAKLRVGDDGRDAIDIRLSLSGQELDLGFRTDSAEARAALADHAQGSLSELLQRSGIQLGDVSVGAQNGQGAGGDARHSASARSTVSSVGRADRSGGVATEAPITPRRPRTDGNRPLDTFA